MANPNVFTVSVGPLCGGGNHSTVSVTVNSGASQTFTAAFTVAQIAGTEFEVDPKDALQTILRNFYKEGNFATLGQFKTAVEAHTFKI